MRVAVVGAGYVGLVTGACLADRGHRVVCVDADPGKVERIAGGDPPIHEPGLAEVLRRNLGHRFRATIDLAGAVRDAELTLICVGTPFREGGIDLSQVEAAARQIGEALRGTAGSHTVVVKSTVVPGTTDEVVRPILEAASGKRVGTGLGLGVNPEFLREGEAVADFTAPDRIILGANDDATLESLRELYRPFGGVALVETSNRTAEMIKYASNALFATMISFANEIGNLCAALGGIDVVDVMRGVHLDRRLSPILPDGSRVTAGLTAYLEAGCGFGGSCFPKDVRALVAHGRRAGVPMALLDAVLTVNAAQPGEVVARVRRHFPTLAGVRVAVLGLAFKPGTDDVRESPAIPVIRELLAGGARVRAFDPVARAAAASVLGDGPEYVDALPAAVTGADAVVVLTRWREFERLPELLATARPQPLVVDGRRMLDRRRIARYEGIGV